MSQLVSVWSRSISTCCDERIWLSILALRLHFDKAIHACPQGELLRTHKPGSKTFLSSKRRAVRTVHVQNDLFDRLAVMNFIHPLTRLVHQSFQKLRTIYPQGVNFLKFSTSTPRKIKAHGTSVRGLNIQVQVKPKQQKA